MSFDWRAFEDEVRTERRRRLALREKGRPYHYWRERGDAAPPPTSHWCDFCAGYFGVPHGPWSHLTPGSCGSLNRVFGGQRVCIECVVAASMVSGG